MIIQPTPAFYQQESTQAAGKRTFAFCLVISSNSNIISDRLS